MASNRANTIFGSKDMAGLGMEESISKAMKDHNLKKITATNYYYEWNRQNKPDKPDERKTVSEDEAVEKILDIIITKAQPEPDAEAIEDVAKDDEEKAAEVVDEDVSIKNIDSTNRFKFKKMQFSGENGEYYIDKEFSLSNSEGSLTFANEDHWKKIKAEIDAAFDFIKNMEVLSYE